MAKAIGLHRIIGETLQEKYNLNQVTYMEIKEERKFQETSQTTSSNDIESQSEKPSNTVQENQ